MLRATSAASPSGEQSSGAGAAREEEDSIVVQAQYVEIYNEQIRDLIEPEHDHLDVREAPGKGTFVAGAAIVNVTSRREL